MQMTLLTTRAATQEPSQTAANTDAAITGTAAAKPAWPDLPADLYAELSNRVSRSRLGNEEVWAVLREWLERHEICPGSQPSQSTPEPAVVRSAPAARRPQMRDGNGVPRLVHRQSLIITARADSFETQLSWLGDLEAEVCSDFAAATEVLAAETGCWTAIIIDLDGFGSIGEMFDEIRALRDGTDVPVILASQHFSDDFSTQRLPLCDVSLRAPASPTLLRLAFSQAEANNLAWKIRKAEAAWRAVPSPRARVTADRGDRG